MPAGPAGRGDFERAALGESSVNAVPGGTDYLKTKRRQVTLSPL